MAIKGATASSYTLTTADIGLTVRYRVTAINLAGTQTARSDATAVVITLPPAVVTPPTIGYPTGATTVTATLGTWKYSPTSYRYQWYRWRRHRRQ